MKHINEYINESILINEFLGFGGSKKQIDFAKQLCCGIRGVSFVFNKAVNKYVKSYISEGEGSTIIDAAFVKGDEIVFCTNNVDKEKYNLSDSKNLRIILLLGKQQYECIFDGFEDDNEKLDTKQQHKCLVPIINKFIGSFGGTKIFDDMYEPLYKYAKENGYNSNADKIQQMMLQLFEALKKKPEGILDFGTEKGSMNTEYINKIFEKLLKQNK